MLLQANQGQVGGGAGYASAANHHHTAIAPGAVAGGGDGRAGGVPMLLALAQHGAVGHSAANDIQHHHQQQAHNAATVALQQMASSPPPSLRPSPSPTARPPTMPSPTSSLPTSTFASGARSGLDILSNALGSLAAASTAMPHYPPAPPDTVNNDRPPLNDHCKTMVLAGVMREAERRMPDETARIAQLLDQWSVQVVPTADNSTKIIYTDDIGHRYGSEETAIVGLVTRLKLEAAYSQAPAAPSFAPKPPQILPRPVLDCAASSVGKSSKKHTNPAAQAAAYYKAKALYEGAVTQMPLQVGPVTVLQFGRIDPTRPAFHCETEIWPIGFKAMRLEQSDILNQMVCMTMEIMDGADLKPHFRVTVELAHTREKATFSGKYPAKPWKEAFERLCKLEKDCLDAKATHKSIREAGESRMMMVDGQAPQHLSPEEIGLRRRVGALYCEKLDLQYQVSQVTLLCPCEWLIAFSSSPTLSFPLWSHTYSY